MSYRQGPRHLSISNKPEVASKQTAENSRDSRDAFDGKVSGYLRKVERYAALGATTTKIALAPTSSIRPQAIVLVHAQMTFDPGSDIGAVGRLNFYQTATDLGVYEPSGLVANELYDLTFLVLE